MMLAIKIYFYIFFIISSSCRIIANQNNYNLRSILKRAELHEKKGEVENAIFMLSELYKKNPNNYTVISRLRTIFMKYEKYDKGIKFLYSHLQKVPNDIQAYTELGEFYFLNGDIEKAKNHWGSGVFDQFKNNRSYFRIMLSLYTKYNLEDDLRELVLFGRKNFGYSFLSYEAGLFYQSKEMYNKAMDEYILNLKFNSSRSNIIQRNIIKMTDNSDSRNIILNKLEKASLDKPNQFLPILADVYFKLQNYNKALNSYKTWASNGTWDQKRWLSFSDDLRKEKAYLIAIDSYNYILKQSNKSEIMGEALLGLAKTFEDQVIPKNRANLIPYFFDKNHFFNYTYELNTSISPTHLETSLEIYDSLLHSLPSSNILNEAYFRMGEIQYRILQDYDRAEKFFQTALEKSPKNSLWKKIVVRQADVFLAQGKIEDANKLIDKMLLINNNQTIRQKKIQIQFLTGEPDSTLTMIEKELDYLLPSESYFNDLIALKNLINQHYDKSNNDKKKVFMDYLNAELLTQQRKLGQAIEKFKLVARHDYKISTVATLRQALLCRHLKMYDEALNLALSLEGTFLSDKGIILSGQILEEDLNRKEEALETYLKIINHYRSSIFSEPIRYHIRKIQEIKNS